MSQSKSKLKVFCRLRNPSSSSSDYSIPYYKINPISNTLEIENKTIFSFHRIFSDSSQKEIFQSVMSPILNEAFINKKAGLVFSYGITNSGKTHTIIGDKSSPGLLPRLFEQLFLLKTHIKERKDFPEGFPFSLQTVLEPQSGTSFKEARFFFEAIEIYNEDIMDLSQEIQRDKMGLLPRTKLKMKEVNKKMLIKGLQQYELTDLVSSQALLGKMLETRSLNETLLNQSSSRSHCLFKLTVSLVYNKEFESSEYMIPILIVDLAGSERAKRVDNYGLSPLMTEACNINKSLLVLGRCLKGLASNDYANNNFNNKNTNIQANTGKKMNNNTSVSPLKPQIIPYRDSKLTRILFEYFNDDCNINMIVNINTNLHDYEETTRVLDYAAIAKQVQPVKSTIGSKFALVSEIKKVKPHEITRFLLENDENVNKLQMIDEKIQNNDEKIQNNDEKNQNIDEKIKKTIDLENYENNEKDKKTQKLEEIIKSLNDQILFNKLMAGYDQIIGEFQKENNRIFSAEQKDNDYFSTYTDPFFLKFVTNQLKVNSDQNKPVNDEKSIKNLKEIGMNTSPSLFINERGMNSSRNLGKSFSQIKIKNEKNHDNEKNLGAISLVINEVNNDLVDNHNNLLTKGDLECENQGELSVSPLGNKENISESHEKRNLSLLSSKSNDLNVEKAKIIEIKENITLENCDLMDNNIENIEEVEKIDVLQIQKINVSKKNKQKNKENKENDPSIINSKKKRKKAKKIKKKVSLLKEEENEQYNDIKEEEEEYNFSLIKKARKDVRQTPIIKRLRIRPNPKKHQCFN